MHLKNSLGCSCLFHVESVHHVSHEPVKYYKGKLNTCAKVSSLQAPFFPTANQLLQHWEVKYIVASSQDRSADQNQLP